VSLIEDVLIPGHVKLGLSSIDKAGGVDEVLALLSGDTRVTDWARLRQAVIDRDARTLAENGIGICLAHGRTESVKSLVLAVGRSTAGIVAPDVSEPVRLVVVAGIPAAFNSEYLRVIGAIVRICRDRHQLERLLAAKTPQKFVELLGAGELKL